MSVPKGAPGDAVFIGPLRQSLRLFTDGHKDAGSLVSVLLVYGRPTAILRAIWAVIIDAINRCSRGSLPHVGGKEPEILRPSRANGDASAAVILPRLRFVALASLNHLPPYSIERMLRLPVLPDVLRAPARLDVAALEFGTNRHVPSTTLTVRQVLSGAALIPANATDHSKLKELIAYRDVCRSSVCVHPEPPRLDGHPIAEAGSMEEICCHYKEDVWPRVGRG